MLIVCKYVILPERNIFLNYQKYFFSNTPFLWVLFYDVLQLFFYKTVSHDSKVNNADEVPLSHNK